MPGRRFRAVAMAACAAAAATAIWRFLTFTGFNNDHYIHLAPAQQMLLGDWPVRDFADPGMPLTYLVSAVARLVGGRALIVEWLVVAGAFAIGAAFTVLAAWRLSGSVTVALMVTLLEVIISPRSYGYPKIVLYAIAAWIIVVAAERMTRGRLVLLGVMTAVAFLFRHDHGLYIGAGALAITLLGHGREEWRRRRRDAGLLLLTIGALLAPWALFVEYHAGLVEYARNALVFARHEATASVLEAMPSIDFTTTLFTPDNSLAWLFYLFHVLPPGCAMLAWWRWRHGHERWDGESAAVAALAVMAVFVNVGFLRDTLAARVPDAIVLAAVLGAWLIAVAWGMQGWAVRTVVMTTTALIVLITTASIASSASVDERLRRAGLLTGSAGAFRTRLADLSARLLRTMPEGDQMPSRYSAALMPFVAYLGRCTSPGDRLLMTRMNPDVYVLANRGFAGGYIAYSIYDGYPTIADQAIAVRRMRTQSVPFALFEEDLGDFRRRKPLIAAFVDERYEALAVIEIEDASPLTLYVERKRRRVGLDAATGWPCFPVDPRRD